MGECEERRGSGREEGLLVNMNLGVTRTAVQRLDAHKALRGGDKVSSEASICQIRLLVDDSDDCQLSASTSVLSSSLDGKKKNYPDATVEFGKVGNIVSISCCACKTWTV